MRVFLGSIASGMGVVDIGANMGYYTLLAAKQVGQSGMVYAFEPKPRNFALLLRNIEENGFTNIEPVQQAVSSRSGPLPLLIGQGGSGTHSLFSNRETSEQSIPVQATTLDDFFEQRLWPRIDVIIMDIQGAEMEALEGMTRLLQKLDSLTLIVEFAPFALEAASVTPMAFLERLQQLGFNVEVILDSGECEPLDAFHLLATLGDEYYVNLLCTRAPSDPVL
ncbi:MAG: FkbM family methyltransferase [Chloroflexota bacterium]|nr:FkbM family methyltransferase [Chloroflexota bacterium]